MLLNLKISEIDRLFFIDFASKYQKTNFFIRNGQSRQFCILNKLTEQSIVKKAISIRNEKYMELGVNEFIDEPIFGIFLGVNNEGGNVHQHKDPTVTDYDHVRINFLLSKPEKGGMPIIEEKELSIEEGDSWLNIANLWKHSSTPVVGNKDRVVLSLGALVPITQMKKLGYRNEKDF